MFRFLTLASLACLLAPVTAFSPSRSMSARVSRQSVLMATTSGDGSSRELRAVKLSLPADSVARKRRRVEESNVDELQEPADENALLMKSESTAVKEETFQGSTSRFGSNVVDSLRGNFWLGTVAPAAVIVWGGRKIITIRKDKFETRQRGLINSYANEMMLNDGNVKALQRVHGDYSREVAKSKKEDMLLEYLRRFFMKQAVSGAAVKSLALMVSLHKLDDSKAAKLFLKIGEEFGAKKPVAVGKVLLLAERILKDSDALATLQPLKDDITLKTYGSSKDADPAVAAKMFETSQSMLLEAALRQVAENLPETLETMDEARDLIKSEARLLGISDDKAMAILDALLEEARMEEVKGDEDEGGEIMAALNAAAEEKEAGAPVNTGDGPLIVDCKCGYVLFVAKGREEKFFGANFQGCPECKAPKADMVVRPPKVE